MQPGRKSLAMAAPSIYETVLSILPRRITLVFR